MYKRKKEVLMTFLLLFYYICMPYFNKKKFEGGGGTFFIKKHLFYYISFLCDIMRAEMGAYVFLDRHLIKDFIVFIQLHCNNILNYPPKSIILLIEISCNEKIVLFSWATN